MNNCELYLVIYTVRFLLISLRNLLYISPKLTNTYKQTSTVIYDRLSVITDGNKSASSSYFEFCLPLVNSPCFHTSMHFTGGSPFHVLAPCLTNERMGVRVMHCARVFHTGVPFLTGALDVSRRS